MNKLLISLLSLGSVSIVGTGLSLIYLNGGSGEEGKGEQKGKNIGDGEENTEDTDSRNDQGAASKEDGVQGEGVESQAQDTEEARDEQGQSEDEGEEEETKDEGEKVQGTGSEGQEEEEDEEEEEEEIQAQSVGQSTVTEPGTSQNLETQPLQS